MNCPTCGTSVGSLDARFCVRCGTPFSDEVRMLWEAEAKAPPAVIDLTDGATPAKASRSQAASGSTRTVARPTVEPPPVVEPPVVEPPMFEPPVVEAPVIATPEAEAVTEQLPAEFSAEQPPAEAPPPPPVERRPRGPAIGVALLAVASLALGVLALAGQKDRNLVLLGAAWATGAVAVAIPLLRGKRRLLHASRVPFAIAMAIVLAAISVPVLQLSCTERLGPNADLRGCDLSGAALSGMDLQQSDLRNAVLTGAQLTGADLDDADLSGANLSGASANSATFAGADLQNAVLDDASLVEANFAEADLSGASLGSVSASTSVFYAAILKGARLDGGVFDNALLERADLSGASIKEASFTSSTLNDATLSAATIDGANFRAANLNGAAFDRATIKGATFQEANLNGAVFDQATMDGANLSETQLIGASFTAATIDGVNFTNATLDRARLNEATLTDVRLNGVSLIAATYTDPQLAQGAGITTAQLAAFLAARGVQLENRSQILRAVAGACGGGQVSGAAPVSGGFHPLVVLGSSGGSLSGWTDRAAELGWEPVAARFTQYVACVQQKEVVVQRCTYNEIGGLGRVGRITRYRNQARVRLFAARTGKSVLDRTYQGSAPSACPMITSFQSNGRIDGSSVDFSTLKPQLSRYVGTNPF